MASFLCYDNSHVIVTLIKTNFHLNLISHFRVSPGVFIKTRLSAQPLAWKWFFILMQIKLIFTRKAVHLASFWNWVFLEFGSGLYSCCRNFSKTLLRWLNTVLRAVSGGACFKLDKQTWRRKKQWYTEDDFAKSTD